MNLPSLSDWLLLTSINIMNMSNVIVEGEHVMCQLQSQRRAISVDWLP